MIKFFSSAYLSRYLALLMMLIVLWIPVFVSNFSLLFTPIAIFSFVNGWLISIPFIFKISSFLIIVISSLLINQVASDTEFSNKYSSLGMYFFILITSLSSEFTSFNPFLLINLFLIFFARNLYKLPSSAMPIVVAFNAALLLSFVSFLFPPLLLLIVILWGALFMHRLNDWRNYLASLIGLSLPYLLMFTLILWEESIPAYFSTWPELFVFVDLFKNPDLSLGLINISIFLFIVFVSVIGTILRLREKNIYLRRNLMITFLFFFITFLIGIFYRTDLRVMLLSAVPASMILTNASLQRKIKLFNISILLLFLLIIIEHYLQFFTTFLQPIQ